MKTAQIKELCAKLLAYYETAGRDMPWRNPGVDGVFDPYRILVSEIMLQQTQVGRVIPKFEAFLHRFPDLETLSNAPLSEVLVAWQGLGYNRRAKFLWQAARRVRESFGGKLPATLKELVALPGIGVNTAGAILAYAYNEPVVFIETNVRTVFIHHLFPGQEQVSDKEIIPLVQETVVMWAKTSGYGPREFYWAVMDYGTFLKASAGNSGRRSAHYVKQSAFKGSKRQLRGAVLRYLAARPHTVMELQELLLDPRTPEVCADLTHESMIVQIGQFLKLNDD